MSWFLRRMRGLVIAHRLLKLEDDRAGVGRGLRWLKVGVETRAVLWRV